MKQSITFFFLLFLFACSKESIVINTKKAIIQSVQTSGGSKNDVAQSISKTTDGGYAILGYTQSNDGDLTSKNDDSFDFWVARYSNEDVLLWNKTYGGSADDRGSDIISTSDNGFLLTGYSTSSDKNVTKNNGLKDFWVIKIDSNGTLVWQNSFGFSGNDYCKTAIQTNDGGFLITGVLDVTASGGQGNSKTAQRHAGGDVWAIKIDNSGNLEWSRYFGGSFTDTPLGIVQTTDNNFIIAASSDSDDVDISNNKGSYDFWLLKISSTGQLIWEKNFGGSEIDEPSAITNTNDGGFLIVGDTRSTDKDISTQNGGADVWIIKIDTDGNLLWQKTIGGSSFDVARSVNSSLDGGFIISGSSRSLDNSFTNQGQNDALVLKIDENGNLIWQKTIGGSSIDFLYDAIQLDNKNIIAVGESNSTDGNISQNKGFTDILIINLSEE